MLTVAFLSHHSKHLITKNIEKIVNYGLNISVLIIENSLDHSFKNELLAKYSKSVEVYIPDENLGYAKGMNKALELSKDNFVLISPPDVDFSFDCLNDLINCIKNFKDFVLIAPTYRDENQFKNYDTKIFSKESKNKKTFKILKNISLPDVITSPNSVYQFEKYQAKGNFITNKVITGNIVEYVKIKNKKLLNNKIVMVENADPGFDFLFGLNIKGLITQYGGVNSHMAIRCLEENIPACIGIGESNYENIKNNKIIELNCFQNNYKLLS